MKKNEGNFDRLIRLLIAILAFIGGYFRLHGTLQIVLYIISAISLFTSITGFCALYSIFKINTNKNKSIKKIFIWIWILVILILGGILAFLSNFFSRKFFLEDFAHMNDSYKQLLFNSGKEKRAESISYYEKLIPAYTQFQDKYSNYKPYVLKNDTKLNSDLETISILLKNIKEAVYYGDLVATHKKLEEIRPIFQDIFKRNGFSMLAVTLVDFHDIMETIIEGADSKDTTKIISTYPIADEKLKEVEAELNDSSIQAIRKNLNIIFDMAKNNQLDLLAKQGADLKSSFVKVYLIKG
ncbi:MAG: DUF2892 domain-containing protein [Candidatus Absconditicoccaceae bacterium]